MSDNEDLFVGWAAQAPAQDRRFLLLASLGLLGAAGLAGTGFALRGPKPGPGRWVQADVRSHSGVLVETPYPMLLSQSLGGAITAKLLVAYGKVALPRLGGPPSQITVQASEIRRGDQVMLAVQDAAGFSALARSPAAPPPTRAEALGAAALIGEIVDAKCWFGAMNPGSGLTHKACAALCAMGGLPLAFCSGRACADGENDLILLVDETGAPHSRAVMPFLADPILADGELVRRNGLREFRVALSALRRI